MLDELMKDLKLEKNRAIDRAIKEAVAPILAENMALREELKDGSILAFVVGLPVGAILSVLVFNLIGG